MLRTATLSFLLYLFMLSSSQAQSTISGTFTSNTTLTKANSPYTVSGDLAVSTGVTVTIEPGVELRFENARKFEVRGTLKALGTAADSITFTALTGTTIDSWSGIYMLNDMGANADFAYCRFFYAYLAINGTCCGTGKITVAHSRFSFNRSGVTGESRGTTIDYCKFTYNSYAVTGSSMRIDHSMFAHNIYGLLRGAQINVYNTTFRYHTETALHGGGGTVSNCIVTDNKVGVEQFWNGFTINNTTISDNGKGVVTSDFGTNAPVTGNRICNNTYNIEHIADMNMSFAGNCFCTSDQALIESKILDGDDNALKGLINYTIYDTDCATVLQQVDKTAPRNITLLKANSPYVFNTDLVIRPLETLVIEPGVELQFAAGKRLEVRGGVLTALGQPGDSIVFTNQPGAAQLNDRWEGILMRHDLGAKASFSYAKFAHANIALSETCCGSSRMTVTHSRFYDNTRGLVGYNSSANAVMVDQCVFEKNAYAVMDGSKKIDHSLFTGNQYGFYRATASVSNSTFKAHTQVALHGGGTISNCIITGNEVGVEAFFSGFTIKNSNISGNGKGIITSADDIINVLTDNKICNNTLYNIEHPSAVDISVAGNCFCTSDSTVIEDKIFDGYDSPQKGLVNYSIYTDDCSNLLRQVDKRQPRTIHLVRANSPYTFNNDLVIRTNETLIVDPGVELRFAPQKLLEVRGKMTAFGTAADSITFTALTGTSPDSWQGITIRNDMGANADFAYARFLYASSAIQEWCCGQENTTVTHSRFSGNTRGMSGYSGNMSTIDHCKFTNNLYAVMDAQKVIDHSVFNANTYGLLRTGSVSVSNSTFENHSAVALHGGRGTVSNCTITGNAVGIEAFFDGFTVKDSNISGNGKGIITGDYDGHIYPITGNKICDNTTYNIEHMSVHDFNIENNCFCTTDSTTIENKIRDGYDNGNAGLLEYSVYSTGCSEVSYRMIVDGNLKMKVGPGLIFKSFKGGSRVTEDQGLMLRASAIVIPGSTPIDTTRYSIVIKPGNNYTVKGNSITPALNYNGTLRIPIQYTDGIAISNEYIHEVTITPVNDPPVIGAYNGSTAFSALGSLEIQPEDFAVTDPDDRYPQDFTITIGARPYYNVTGTTVAFTGTGHGNVEIPITFSDGEAAVLYTIIAQTNLITAIGEAETSGTAPYPNPFADRIMLHRGAPTEILTVTGQRVSLVVNAEGEIETSHLPAGMYVLKASVDGKDLFYRMVKK